MGAQQRFGALERCDGGSALFLADEREAANLVGKRDDCGMIGRALLKYRRDLTGHGDGLVVAAEGDQGLGQIAASDRGEKVILSQRALLDGDGLLIAAARRARVAAAKMDHAEKNVRFGEIRVSGAAEMLIAGQGPAGVSFGAV